MSVCFSPPSAGSRTLSSAAPLSISVHVSRERMMRPSSCSSMEKTRLGPLQTIEVWNSSPSAPVDTETVPSVEYFCTACREFSEPRTIVVSTVNWGPLRSIRSVTSPLRFGWQRSLSCFHRPEKSGAACGHEVTPAEESRKRAIAQIRMRPLARRSLVLIRNVNSAPAWPALLPYRIRKPGSELKPQRELHLARRSRSYRGDGRYDGGVQVDGVGDLAEPRPCQTGCGARG